MKSLCVRLAVVLVWGIRQQGEPLFISKEQKQSAAPAGSSSLGSSFHFSHPSNTDVHRHTPTLTYCTYANVHAAANTRTHSGKHPMTFHAYSHKQIDNSPESLNTSQVWTHKHRHTFFLDFIFKEVLRHRRQGAEGKRSSRRALHTLEQIPLPSSTHRLKEECQVWL